MKLFLGERRNKPSCDDFFSQEKSVGAKTGIQAAEGGNSRKVEKQAKAYMRAAYPPE